MLEVQQIIGRLRSKPAFFFAAGVLMVLNFGRMGMNFYEERRAELDTRIELLSKNQATSQKLEGLRSRVEILEGRKNTLDEYLFEGQSEEQIASSMQILLQEKVSKAGLQAESIRPTIKGDNKALARDVGKDKDNKNKDKNKDKKDKDKDIRDFGDIAIKMRLNGTLEQFAGLVMDLYRMNKLFRIESFMLKPTKKNDLQILFDLVGYYRLENKVETTAGAGEPGKQTAVPASASPAPPAATSTPPVEVPVPPAPTP